MDENPNCFAIEYEKPPSIDFINNPSFSGKIVFETTLPLTRNSTSAIITQSSGIQLIFNESTDLFEIVKIAEQIKDFFFFCYIS